MNNRRRFYYSIGTVLTLLMLTLLTACGDSSTPVASAPTSASTTAAVTSSGSGITSAPNTTLGATTLAAATTVAPTPTVLIATAGNSNAKVTLNYMAWGGDTGFTAVFKRTQQLNPEFSDFGFKLLVPGGGDTDVANALRLALTSGKDIPDAVQLNRTQLAEFAQSGELMDLTSAITPFKNDLYDGAVNVATYDGKIYAFPQEAKSKLFYYRSDLFDQAGIKFDSIKTLPDLVNAGKQLRAKFPKSSILNMGPNSSISPSFLIEFLSAYPNLSFADNDGNYQLTKNPAFAEVFKTIKDLYDGGVTSPVDDWSNDWKPAFNDSSIAGAMSANWLAYFIPQFAPDQGGKWKVGFWPANLTSVDQRYGSEGGGSIVVVPKRAPHAKEAVQYLTKVFLDKKTATANFEAGGLTPLVKSAKSDVLSYVQTAKKPDNLTSDQWTQTPFNFFGQSYVETNFQSLDYVKVFNYDPSAQKELDIIGQWLPKYVTGKVSLNDALAKAQADMEGQIGNPYQK